MRINKNTKQYITLRATSSHRTVKYTKYISQLHKYRMAYRYRNGRTSRHRTGEDCYCYSVSRPRRHTVTHTGSRRAIPSRAFPPRRLSRACAHLSPQVLAFSHAHAQCTVFACLAASAYPTSTAAPAGASPGAVAGAAFGSTPPMSPSPLMSNPVAASTMSIAELTNPSAPGAGASLVSTPAMGSAASTASDVPSSGGESSGGRPT